MPRTTKKYSEEDMRTAVGKVLKDGWTVYKASKEYAIPYNTLKDRLSVSPSAEEMPSLKKGRPFNLSEEEELKVVSYVTEMQSVGFRLTATDVRKYAFKMSKLNSKKNNRFNEAKGIAGWDWWMSFKDRYSMQLPENLSMNRTAAASEENVADFNNVLEETVLKYGISVFKQLLSSEKIKSGFKSDALNHEAVPKDAFSVSNVHSSEEAEGIKEVEENDIPLPIRQGVRRRKSTPQKVRVFEEDSEDPMNSPDVPSTSGLFIDPSDRPSRKRSRLSQSSDRREDVCQACNGHFGDKRGGGRICCAQCRDWFHITCMNLKEHDPNFVCLACEQDSD